LYLYRDHVLVKNVTIIRQPGSPNEQEITFPITFTPYDNWTVVAIYTPPDDPENGCEEGANPFWLIFSYADPDWYNSSYLCQNECVKNYILLHHTFVVAHNNTWVWNVDLNEIFMYLPITFVGKIFDQGADDQHLDVYINNTKVWSREFVSTGTPTDIQIKFSALFFPVYCTCGDNETRDCYDSRKNRTWYSNTIRFVATDDDGAMDDASVYVYNNSGELAIYDLAPKVGVKIIGTGMEDSSIKFICMLDDKIVNNNYTIFWKMGDGTSYSAAIINHTYYTQGEYLVRVYVVDGNETSVGYWLLHVENKPPKAEIRYENSMTEDSPIKFWVDELFETPSDKQELAIFWDYGDGLVGVGMEDIHTYRLSGNYTVRLIITDDNGARMVIRSNISIRNMPPRISADNGTFEGVEGQSINISVVVSDSIADMMNMYTVIYVDGRETQGLRMTYWNDDGEYIGYVAAGDGDTGSSIRIKITIMNVQPQIIVSTFVYYGEKQETTIRAYIMDAFTDIGKINTAWSIDGVTLQSTTTGTTAEAKINITNTGLYTITIIANDNTEKATFQYYISIKVDSDGDDLLDELEDIWGTSPHKSDTDGDGITDYWETTYTKTDPNDYDTDDDNLTDGYDPNMGVGELVIGTDPLDPDTDNDNLTDGIEVLGWRIKVTLEGNVEREYKVTSNPFKVDSDNDGLGDYDEYILGTDPKANDTDGDGFSDYEEVELYGTNPSSWDTDGDGLGDSYELEKYTVISDHWDMLDTWEGDTTGERPAIYHSISWKAGHISTSTRTSGNFSVICDGGVTFKFILAMYFENHYDQSINITYKYGIRIYANGVLKFDHSNIRSTIIAFGGHMWHEVHKYVDTRDMDIPSGATIMAWTYVVVLSVEEISGGGESVQKLIVRGFV